MSIRRLGATERKRRRATTRMIWSRSVGGMLVSVALFAVQPKNRLNFNLGGDGWEYFDSHSCNEPNKHLYGLSAHVGFEYQRSIVVDWIYARVAAGMGVSRIGTRLVGSKHIDYHSAVGVTGLATLGMDLLWFGLESGVACYKEYGGPPDIIDIPCWPSFRSRIGPKLINARIGFFNDTAPIMEAPIMEMPLLSIGIGSETNRWRLSVDFSPLSFDSIVALAWKWRQFEFGGKVKFRWDDQDNYDLMGVTSFGWQF
ncbi:MAG: hypothetical protein J7M25_03625 [Deltaproteobacteria bacterium]|nr:hypothetical protein [Deltaproteobacteria bacterium]